MSLLVPKSRETRKNFVVRFMADDDMCSEFPNAVQRQSACHNKWKGKKPAANSQLVICEQDEDGRSNMKGSKKNIRSLSTLMSDLVRKDTLEDEEHYVVPVVLMTEGVHKGILYSSEELSKFPDAWNGEPCPVGHPVTKEGHPATANAPQVLETMVPGRLFNCKFENDALKGEVWLNIAKCAKVEGGLDVLRMLEADSPIEVSTGVFIECSEEEGDWNGEEYTGVAKNLRPDHLALLPGGVGACSWQDGAGMPRINEDTSSLFYRLAVLIAKANKVKVNELTHDDIRQGLNAIVRAEANDNTFVWVREVYDGYFIYEMEQDGLGLKLFKQSYSVDAEESLVLVGEAIEVRQEVSFVPVNNSLEGKNAPTAGKEEGDGSMNRKERVAALIANGSWGEDQREWLETLEDGVFETVEKTALNQKTEGDEEPKLKVIETPAPAAIEEVDKPKTAGEYIEAMEAPDGIKGLFRSSLAQHENRKATLVAALVANKACRFTEDALKLKDVEELETLCALAGSEADDDAGPDGDKIIDYSLRGGGPLAIHANDEEPLALPSLEVNKAEGEGKE